jgi:dihydroflavonol-4-reductase
VNATCRRDPIPMYRVNVLGTQAVIRAAARAGARRVVLTSSAAAVGEARGTTGREDSPHRGSFLSHYERSKWLAERRAFATAEGVVELVAVNPASVQGPGRTTGTGRLLIAAMNGRVPAVVNTTVSLVDVDDCARGHVLAAERGEDGHRYLLSGASLPMPELSAMIRRIAGGSTRPIPRIPPALVPIAGGIGEVAAAFLRRDLPLCADLARTIRHGHRYDGTRAARELGLRYTPVDETLRRTFAWYLDEGLVRRPSPPA